MSPIMRGSPDPIIGLQRQFYGKNPMGVYSNAAGRRGHRRGASPRTTTPGAESSSRMPSRNIYKDIAVAPIVAGVTAYATGEDLVFTPAAQDPAVIYLSHIAAK